jgi:ubiquinone/menaquinone biosynthesis C-methylase UbiE
VGRLAAELVGEGGIVAGFDLSPAMLAVARQVAPGIDWHQAAAERLPFPPRSFDAVLCQQGVQFFPDRPAALAEFARVLIPGGRVVLSVCAAIDQSPGYAAMADGIEQALGRDAAASLRDGPFGFPSGEALQELVIQAGFRSVRLSTQTVAVSFPSVAEWVRRFAVSTPLVDAFAHLTPEARQHLVAEVARLLGLPAEHHVLTFPVVSNVVVGTSTQR